MRKTLLKLGTIYFAFLTTSECLSQSTGNQRTECAVWDHVLDRGTAHRLHWISKDDDYVHRAFSRDPSKPKSETERALDSILTELSDNSTYVEYWTRHEWKSIEAHADVDERLAKGSEDKNEVEYRYPTHGHVLYLQVGTEVKGPTCVFPGRKSGGDLLKSANTHDGTDTSVELITVPAVQGRLLRFGGDYLHAVPRPHNLWLLSFVKGAPQTDPEELWGRSVILFNTWDDEPPLRIPLNRGEDSESPSTVCNAKSKWVNMFHKDEADTCDEQSDEEEPVNAKVWLLGSERRREHPMRTIKLKAPATIETALSESTTVSHLFLQQP